MLSSFTIVMFLTQSTRELRRASFIQQVTLKRIIYEFIFADLSVPLQQWIAYLLM